LFVEYYNNYFNIILTNEKRDFLTYKETQGSLRAAQQAARRQTNLKQSVGIAC